MGVCRGVGGWAFGVMFGLAALAVAVGAIRWVQKMPDVVVRLPWTLDRTLNDR